MKRWHNIAFYTFGILLDVAIVALLLWAIGELIK